MKSAKIIVLLLILTCGSAFGAEFGKWFTDTKSDKFLYAATMNDSGSLLGQFCFFPGGSCVWLIGMDTSCNSGDEYTVLANSDAGSAPLKVLCDGQLENGQFRYVFGDFEQIDGLVKKGTRIGFAVPLQTDEFRVVRFPLNGARESIAIMRSIAERRTTSSPGTKDQTL